MTVSVTHQKVSAIADDPASVAAGEVVPSDWNAEHTIIGVLEVANGGTGVTTSTGTGSVVLSSGPTLGPAVVISGSSANPGLTITQTGAGHALLIEDEASTDATPIVVNNAGSVILGSTTQPAVGTAGAHKITVSGASAADASFLCYRSDVSAGPATFTFGKTRGTDPLNSGDVVGRLEAAGRDATSAGGGDERTPIARIEFAADAAAALDNMPGRIVFQTTASGSNTPTERMRIDSAGNVGIGGTPTSDSLRITGTAAGATTINAIIADETIGSGITANYRSILSRPVLENATFTLTNLYHFYANPQTKPASPTLTNQYGYHAESTLTGATNNFGFYSNIASTTNRWNFYANGTASNHFTGTLSIGTPAVTYNLEINKSLTGGVERYQALLSGEIQSDVTTLAIGILNTPTINNSAFTLATYRGFQASAASISGAATISAYHGFFHGAVTAANITNTYGYTSNIAASGTARWNFYAGGTAPNYFAGSTYVLGTGGDQALNVNGAVRVANTTSANQTSAGTMDFTSGAMRFLVWGASSVQGTFSWWTGTGALGATQRMTLDGSANLGLATSTFGTSATNTFAVFTGTAPTTGPADTVQFYSTDLSAGNTIPSFYTEGTNVGTGTPTANRTIAVRFNGTVYYLLASTTA